MLKLARTDGEKWLILKGENFFDFWPKMTFFARRSGEIKWYIVFYYCCAIFSVFLFGWIFLCIASIFYFFIFFINNCYVKLPISAWITTILTLLCIFWIWIWKLICKAPTGNTQISWQQLTGTASQAGSWTRPRNQPLPQRQEAHSSLSQCGKRTGSICTAFQGESSAPDQSPLMQQRASHCKAYREWRVCGAAAAARWVEASRAASAGQRHCKLRTCSCP